MVVVTLKGVIMETIQERINQLKAKNVQQEMRRLLLVPFPQPLHQPIRQVPEWFPQEGPHLWPIHRLSP